MTNSTSTDTTFGGAWSNGIIVKQQGCYYTVLADKQVNDGALQLSTPLFN